MKRLARTLFKWLFRLLLAGLLLAVAVTLPLRWVDPPSSAFMLLDRYQHQRTVRHEWVPMAGIPGHLALAVIASEDQNFPHHFGFDLGEIRGAVETRMEGGRLRGASTISQQLARNLYLWPERSWLRKGLEFGLTLPLELFLPKHRMLEIYLNIAEFGEGVFGAEAAAQHYFAKPAARLSRDEAALLAAVLPAPGRYRVDQPSTYLRDRQRWIIGQMENLGPQWVPQPDPDSSQ